MLSGIFFRFQQDFDLRFSGGRGILAAVARKRKDNPPAEPDRLQCMGIVRTVQPLVDRLAEASHPRHGNVRLELSDAVVVMLAGFFNPMVRSLRLIEQMSQMPRFEGLLGVDRVCRSTLSDAMSRFDPERLRPLIEMLVKQVPALARTDGDLHGVCQRIIALDGSYWNVPADVLWALAQNRGGKGKSTRRAVRMNWQVQVDTFTPVDVSASGADEGSEPAAFIRHLIEGVIYVADRNFVHFDFINSVLDKKAQLVLRLRKDTKFEVSQILALTAEDRAAGVQSDKLGKLCGSAQKSGRSRTGMPPAQTLREIIIVDPESGDRVRIITSLLDLPAHVIGAIYRHRWQIELFFRWLKVYANFDHLVSHNKKGITLQFYVAIIACLLLHLRTGRKVNKYALFLLGQVAAGEIDFDGILPMLDRIEREKELERQRKRRKKAASKNLAQLPA